MPEIRIDSSSPDTGIRRILSVISERRRTGRRRLKRTLRNKPVKANSTARTRFSCDRRAAAGTGEKYVMADVKVYSILFLQIDFVRAVQKLRQPFCLCQDKVYFFLVLDLRLWWFFIKSASKKLFI